MCLSLLFLVLSMGLMFRVVATVITLNRFSVANVCVLYMKGMTMYCEISK